MISVLQRKKVKTALPHVRSQRQKVLRTEGGFIPKGLAVGLPLSHPVFLCTIETREQKICGRGEKETKKQEKNK